MPQPDAPPLILMVEDEPLLLMNAAETLSSAGFRLVGAVRADEALSQLRQLADEVAVAVVDLGLPDLPGDQLARRLREIRPALPIIIASGYSRRRLKTLLTGMDGVAFLEKPYGTAELTAAVQSLCDASRRPAESPAEPLARADDAHVVAGE